MVMGHRKVIYYAGGDSTSGLWDVEKMQRKWTIAVRKPEQETFRGVLREPPSFLLAQPQELRWMDAWPTEDSLHLSSLLEKFP